MEIKFLDKKNFYALEHTDKDYATLLFFSESRNMFSKLGEVKRNGSSDEMFFVQTDSNYLLSQNQLRDIAMFVNSFQARKSDSKGNYHPIA